MTYNVTR